MISPWEGLEPGTDTLLVTAPWGLGNDGQLVGVILEPSNPSDSLQDVHCDLTTGGRDVLLSTVPGSLLRLGQPLLPLDWRLRPGDVLTARLTGATWRSPEGRKVRLVGVVGPVRG